MYDRSEVKHPTWLKFLISIDCAKMINVSFKNE